jgi:hypothetical protein
MTRKGTFAEGPEWVERARSGVIFVYLIDSPAMKRPKHESTEAGDEAERKNGHGGKPRTVMKEARLLHDPPEKKKRYRH